MNTNDVVKLATAYAAGDLAYEGLADALGGTVADKVVALVASVGVAGIAAKVADHSVELLREVPVAKQALDITDSIIGGVSDAASDVLDGLNPFNW